MSIEQNAYFRAVVSHLDAMLQHGRGVTPDGPTPLFAGVVDVSGRRPINGLMIPPPGIRTSDYNWAGNNLMHDIPMLEAMLHVGRLTDADRYAAAIDEMLAFYGERCPHPATGMFPWGEHAQWGFEDQRPLPCQFGPGLRGFTELDYMIHDHLRHAPAWFWQIMWKQAPQAVVNFAHGLDGHIVDAATFEHNRHGKMATGWWHDPQNPTRGQGKDFARHAGFFIFDALFAYSKSGDNTLLDWAKRKLQWHMDRRLPNGLVSGCARSKVENQEGQHDSLMLLVWEAARLLDEDDPGAAYFLESADELVEAKRNHCEGRPLPEPDVEGDPARRWVLGYFRKPGSGLGLTGGSNAELIARRFGIDWYRRSTIAAADWSAEHLPEPPAGVPLLPRAYFRFLDVATSAYSLSGEDKYLREAQRIADYAMRDFYRSGMFTGVSNLKIWCRTANAEYHLDPWAEPDNEGFYYSVSGTASLIRALLRLAVLQETGEDGVGVDEHNR